MKTLLTACAVALSLAMPAWAQQPATQSGERHFVLENTQIIPVQSQSTGRTHELVVVLPASYASHPEKRYPVLYYLDAYWDTPLLTATYGNLIYDNQVPEFIMVGLSCPAGANYGVERRRDYTITATDGDGKSGRADAFLNFITKEVAPLIESRFRAEKTDRVISGSSLGGLFAIAAAYKAPGFFAGHIAISPAAGWAPPPRGTPARRSPAGRPTRCPWCVAPDPRHRACAARPGVRSPACRIRHAGL